MFMIPDIQTADNILPQCTVAEELISMNWDNAIELQSQDKAHLGG